MDYQGIFTKEQPQSFIDGAAARGEVYKVSMNELGGTIFQDLPCIGTDGLGSSTVLVIVSKYAALVGHVLPRPPDSHPNDFEAGDVYARDFTLQTLDTYWGFREQFPRESTKCFVVSAVYNGAVALPDQQRIISEELRRAGLQVDISHTYNVPMDNQYPDRGSVMVDSRRGFVRVFVEGRPVYAIRA